MRTDDRPDRVYAYGVPTWDASPEVQSVIGVPLQSTPPNQELADSIAWLIDADSMDLVPLLMDVHAALAYLHGSDPTTDATTCLMIRRHARRTLGEAVDLLDGLTISDQRRRYLESQIAILKTRLMLLGEEFNGG